MYSVTSCSFSFAVSICDTNLSGGAWNKLWVRFWWDRAGWTFPFCSDHKLKMRWAHKLFFIRKVQCYTVSAGDDKFHSLRLLTLNQSPIFHFKWKLKNTSSLCIHSLLPELDWIHALRPNGICEKKKKLTSSQCTFLATKESQWCGKRTHRQANTFKATLKW